MKCKELIVNDNSLTLPSDIKKVLNNSSYTWLNKAEFDNAIIEIDENENVIWRMGTWYKGHWHGNRWLDGIWHNGYWHSGEWHNGLWKDGVWINGTWHNGIWKQGDWIKGEKRNTYML